MIKINVTDVDRIPDGDAKKDGFQKNLTHFVSNPGFTLQINFINKEWYYLPPTFMKQYTNNRKMNQKPSKNLARMKKPLTRTVVSG